MPDIERDPVVSSHWPLKLQSYTREKNTIAKIKNVSNRVEKYSRVGRAI